MLVRFVFALRTMFCDGLGRFGRFFSLAAVSRLGLMLSGFCWPSLVGARLFAFSLACGFFTKGRGMGRLARI